MPIRFGRSVFLRPLNLQHWIRRPFAVILSAAHLSTSNRIDLKVNERLIGNRVWIREVAAGKEPAQVQAVLRTALDDFLQVRRKYLLY